MRSCGLKTEKLCVNAGIAEGKPSYVIVLSKYEGFQEKYDDDYLSNEIKLSYYNRRSS